jgi:hypothetical protein
LPPPDHQETTVTTPDDKPSSPFTTPRFVIAAAVVVLVAVLGVGLVFFGGNDDTDPTPPTASGTSSSASSPAGTSAAEPAGGDCDLPAGDQTVPVTTPTDTDWELVGTVAAPTAPDTVGPAVVDPDTGLRSCYAASPLGALYASVGFLAATTDLDQLPGAASELTADGPGRDSLIALVERDPRQVVGSNPGGYQIAGYTFLNYSDDVASLRLAINANGTLASLPITVIRQNGDWRVDLPPDGDLAAGTEQLPTLAGYVLWSGV